MTVAGFSFIEYLGHPQQTGIVIYISGILFALGVYHLLLFFQHKDKVYLYYALYALLVFVYTFHRAEHFILADLAKPIIPSLHFLYDATKWLYSTTYLLFAITFVDFKLYYPNKYAWLMKFIYLSLGTLALATIISIINGDNRILDYGYNFAFLPVLFMLSLYILYLVVKSQSAVKYYLLIGAGTYLIVTSYSHYLTYSGHPFRVLFYAATAFEMFLFALGLGAKQKKLMQEKNRWQALIIKEQEENLKVKETLTQLLGKKVDVKDIEIEILKKEKEEEIKKKLALAYSKQILQLRVQAVQAQMNPHFLFNALNSIKNYIINNNQKEAILYLTKFAKLIRHVLEYSKRSAVSLREELDLMQLYVDVENIRYNKSIDFQMQIASDIDLNRVKLPPMILQAYLENAIWHGLALKKGARILRIKITKQMPFICIEIEDNGVGRKKALEITDRKNATLQKESLGLKLTEERLRIFTQAFKNKYKVEIIDLYDQENQPTGTRVVLHIPV